MTGYLPPGMASRVYPTTGTAHTSNHGIHLLHHDLHCAHPRSPAKSLEPAGCAELERVQVKRRSACTPQGAALAHRLLSTCVLLQILVREPYGVLQSFSAVLEPTQQELGYTVRLGFVRSSLESQ